MRTMKKVLCMLLVWALLCAGVPAVLAADYAVSSTALKIGENRATTAAAHTTLYVFKPAEAGVFTVSVDDAAATLSYWYGSKFFVTGLAYEAVDGTLEVECSSAGQPLLIGLSGVESAVITIVEQEGYVPPEVVVFEPYQNVHTPVDDFVLPTEELTRVDIMKPQTVVADADGICHLGSMNGPILYVNMCAATYADLYACYHPTGGPAALYMHGSYVNEEGKRCGYEFLEAMRPYAEALDGDGYYYLTVDLAAYIQIYGKNQGWFRKDASPFSLIKQGKFIEESAWLVNAYYVAPSSVPGDANGDGAVNNRDVAMVQQYINKWDVSMDLDACDVNDDGAVNNRDVALMQQYINKWDVELR